ncbi:hypothetical protein M6D93_15450 [Jatrophihabitans telluris]|uniref:Uncharacterized protein n=1 Tax=Jatrophihabitans telluris TaxID=2038343 RepID=A0ABY4QVJ9_9ACTN|nr:hypothetical protein [Jatrophihabitans telluris]UQX87686.1 hypothetical protein M6D93_15450 [Jatrophihabitans telluris]
MPAPLSRDVVPPIELATPGFSVDIDKITPLYNVLWPGSVSAGSSPSQCPLCVR